ncbi:MAG: hypothetical protein ACXWQ5_21685, partial [Ktedonobacterales bacterium]
MAAADAQPDDSEPTPERQAELSSGYGANVAAGKASYQDVVIRTRGELSWIIKERGWATELLDIIRKLSYTHQVQFG